MINIINKKINEIEYRLKIADIAGLDEDQIEELELELDNLFNILEELQYGPLK